MSWEEINQLFLLPVNSHERHVYGDQFSKTEPYNSIYRFSEQFNRFHLVFKANCLDLLEEIDRFRNGTGKIGDKLFSVLEMYADQGLQYKHALTATQLLVNFLSSAHFTKDVTRALVRDRIANPMFFKEYEREVAERFENNIDAQLLHKMANFQHGAIPEFGSNIEVSTFQGGLRLKKADIVLNRDNLLTGKWNKDLINRIEEMSDEDGYIAIRDAVANYCHLQEEFTFWLMKRLYDIYKNEIEEMNDVLRHLRGSD